MGFSGVLLALTAVQAISQISEGKAQKREAEFNASLIEGKADLIDVQSEIEQGQFQKMKGEYLSTSLATVAKQGIMPQGSAMAVMLNTQTQIEIDQTISKFNFEQEKRFTQSEADAQRRAGVAAVRTSRARAFSTLLTGASNFAAYNLPTKSTQFDSNTIDPKGGGGK